jgi:PAS domain S-box-containing protein
LILEALLAALLCAVAFVAVWRHGASRRATRAAARFEDLAVKHERQGRLLERVTDSQPHPIFILDTDNRLRFANRAMAERAQMARDDLIGKPLANVIGTASARPYEHGARRALDDRRMITTAIREGAGDGLRVAHVEQVPVEDSDDARSAVLVVEHDITDTVRERERRERTLDQLVRTLLTVVDRRDPYAADHSTQVATVARAIAEEMSLDDETVEAAAVAGSVMNLGKILVPSDVLTRAGGLDAGELDQVRDSIRASADLLRDVDFDGPVVEALRQIEERWDGAGPRGLQGDDILMPARIVAVANAFVAMVCPRSWRVAASFDEAIAQLTDGAGAAYDRRVVAALVNRLENRGAREAWRDMANEPVTA